AELVVEIAAEAEPAELEADEGQRWYPPLTAEHSRTHEPSHRDCIVCQTAKIKKTPAKRKKPGEQTKAIEFGGRVHLDLVGPTGLTWDGFHTLFVARDDATSLPGIALLKRKRARDTTLAWCKMYGPDEVKVIACDNGLEFSGDFERMCLKRGIVFERSIPDRPMTNARAERFHLDLENGIRCSLFESGLPYEMWGKAAVMWSLNRGRSPLESGPTPYFLKMKEDSLLTLRPFGMGVIYLNDSAAKFEPKGRLGVVLGYAQRKSVEILDVAAFQRGVIRIITTRDFKDFPALCFPFKELEASRGIGWQFECVLDRQLCKTCRHVIAVVPVTCEQCLSHPDETDLMVKGKVFAHHKKYVRLEFGHSNEDSCRLIRCFCTGSAADLNDDREQPRDEEEELDDNILLSNVLDMRRADPALRPEDAVDWPADLSSISSISEIPSLPAAAGVFSAETEFHGFAFTVTSAMEEKILDSEYIRGFGLVYASLSPTDKRVTTSADAQAAIDKEINKMIKYFVR
ncbi:unnamed protein product, partial [Polarella glacialis]